MKKLKEFINIQQNIESKFPYIKENYIGNGDVICQLEDGTILTDFNDF